MHSEPTQYHPKRLYIGHKTFFCMNTQKWVSEPPAYYWCGYIRKLDGAKAYVKYNHVPLGRYYYQANYGPKRYESVYFEDFVAKLRRRWRLTPRDVNKIIDTYIFM